MNLYTLKRAAEYLHVSETTIKNYIRLQQLIPAERIGRNWLFTREALDTCAAIPRHAGGPRKIPKDSDHGLDRIASRTGAAPENP